MNSENKNVKVLLVDDDTLLGNELAEQLAGYGYTVSHFSSVKDIAATIDAMQPDVLVFDVEIGTENGIEAAQSLYDGNPSLPIIFISSHHADEMKEKGLRAGGVAYLDKPFTPKLFSRPYRPLCTDDKKQYRNIFEPNAHWHYAVGYQKQGIDF